MLRILLSTSAFNKPKSDRCLITLVLLSIALAFNFNTKNIESFFLLTADSRRFVILVIIVTIYIAKSLGNNNWIWDERV